MKKLLHLAIAGFLIVACKKDSDELYELSYPSVFYAKEVTNIKPLRLFTANGEVKDQAVIDKFVTDNESFFSQHAIEGDKAVIDSIHFNSASEVKVFNWYDGLGTFGLSRNGNDIVFTASQSTSSEMDTTTFTSIMLSSLYYPLLNLNKRDPIGPFFWYDYTVRKFATQISADQLIIPSMIITIQRPGNGGWYSVPINNRFNPHFDFTLIGGPTSAFAVLEFNLVMQKSAR